jgi:hypothetical protein
VHRADAPAWRASARDASRCRPVHPPACRAWSESCSNRIELDDVTLVGNDTGGAIVQLVAADGAERVGRIVLVSWTRSTTSLPA